MSNDALLLNGIVGILIILTVWLIGNSNQHSQVAGVDVPISVQVKDGVFVPSLIQVPSGKPIRLHFFRTDMSPCAGTLLFREISMSYRLPLNQWVEIELPALTQGEVNFSCPAGFLRGKMIVGP